MFKLGFLGLGSQKKSDDETDLRLIVGLGNPGEKYAKTYHNVGYLYLDTLSGGTFKKYKNFGFTKTGDLVLVRPDTFMNESGRTVKQAMKHFKAKPNQILIVHDDSDIQLGSYKISRDRGTAGHNGIESVVRHLKTKDFLRLRIGVRHSGAKAGDFVLRKISKTNLEKLTKVFSEIDIPYRKT